MTSRVLPVDEWDRLAGHALAAPMPDGRPLYAHLDPAVTHILVVERDGAILGSWALTTLWHAEGCCIPVQNAAVARALLVGMAQLIQDMGLPGVYTGSETDAVANQLSRLGARKIAMQVWYLPAVARKEA